MARPNTNFESKRLELIKIAFELFMKQGYENTTISNILKSAGISKGAMYHYFESKDEILDAVLNYIIDLDVKPYEGVLDDSNLSAWEKFVILVRKTDHEIPEEVQEVTQYVLQRPASVFDYRTKELSCKRSVPGFIQIIKEGVASGEFQTEYPEEVAEMILAIGQSMNIWVAENMTMEKAFREIDYFADILGYSLKLEEEKTQQIAEILKEKLNN